jgi:oligopeptide transport system substrate-binding protein
METNPDLGVIYDPDKALEELALALEDMGLTDVSELPPITLSHNESESHARIAEAIAQMWADLLGVEVQITTQEWKVFIANIMEGNATQVFRSSWFMDYADTSNFLYDFLGPNAGGCFRMGWNHEEVGGLNEEYDALVEEAMLLEDTEARRELYVQAEEILVVEDAVLSPIYWYTVTSMTKPYVNRTYAKSGHQRYEKWSFAEE